MRHPQLALELRHPRVLHLQFVLLVIELLLELVLLLLEAGDHLLEVQQGIGLRRLLGDGVGAVQLELVLHPDVIFLELFQYLPRGIPLLKQLLRLLLETHHDSVQRRIPLGHLGLLLLHLTESLSKQRRLVGLALELGFHSIRLPLLPLQFVLEQGLVQFALLAFLLEPVHLPLEGVDLFLHPLRRPFLLGEAQLPLLERLVELLDLARPRVGRRYQLGLLPHQQLYLPLELMVLVGQLAHARRIVRLAGHVLGGGAPLQGIFPFQPRDDVI
mmetsp:Transcript_17375/g.37498  ORF Transcript_17375/g.37498 Transcript_17375/m.37498 type:complete len:272 (+) Transcript_17375:3393-4208(+)